MQRTFTYKIIDYHSTSKLQTVQLTLFEYFKYLKREFSLNFAVLSKGIQLYEQGLD